MRQPTTSRLLEVLIAPALVAVAAAQAIREAFPPRRAGAQAGTVPRPVHAPPPAQTGEAPARSKAESHSRETGGYWSMLKAAAKDWSDDDAPQLGAALSYYTIFSLAPILVIVIAVAGLVFGEAAARGEIVGQIQGLVGQQGAQMVQTMLENTSRPGQGIVALIAGVVTLVLGATGAVIQLQKSLDQVWDVRFEGSGIKGQVTQRLRALALVLGVGFLLLVSLVVSAALSGLSGLIERTVGMPPFVLQLINIVVSIAVLTVLFAMIFRYLPHVEIAWRDVWVGAATTAVLFTIGKFLIGLYLGQSSVGSTYGAAGSLAILLIWIYYSAQIVLFGAEVTQVYANRTGARIRPSEHAVAAA